MTDPISIRPYAPSTVSLPTGAEASAFDRRAIEGLGVPQPALMEAAGRAAADVLDRLHPAGRVVALVGSGNNGGDALVLLRTLAGRGREVSAVFVCDRAADDPLLHGWPVPVTLDSELASDDDWDQAIARADVLVDGILGTGISGAPRERQATAIRAAGRCEAPVFALDVPSGVDADTGRAPGEAIRARATVGFGWPKLGTVLSPGREYAGRLIGVEIGFPPTGDGAFLQEAITPSWAAMHRPRRQPDTHKNAVGSLLVAGGRPGMAGAVILAARAALRSGTGFVRVASAPENREVLQTALPEAVFVDATDAVALSEALEASRAVVAGPGLGTEAFGSGTLERVMKATGTNGTDVPTVLDADALNLLARDGDIASALAGRPVLLTPHPGEMSRLEAAVGLDAEAPRIDRARAMADATGAVVLFKGMPSIVAEPDGPVMVDTVATSDLAQAGMGDVLAGAAGGFAAQGADPLTAGGLGLYHAGRAAVRAERGAGTSPEDIVSSLPDTLNESGPGRTDLELPCVTFDLDAPR